MNRSHGLKIGLALGLFLTTAVAAWATVPPPSILAIPTLDPLSLGALASLLGGAGFVIVRRRRK